MIDTTWTQGLTIDEDAPRDLVTEDGELIATCYGRTKTQPGRWDDCPEALANTRLFASAADLDDALGYCLAELQCFKAKYKPRGAEGALVQKAIDKASGAMAKARGEA